MSIGGVVLQFSADTRSASRQIDKLTRSLKEVGDGSISTSDKMAKAAKFGIAGLAAGAAGGVFALGKLATASISLAADFEESQNVLQSALGASQSEMTKLSEYAKKMGADTVFGARDASDAMIELAKAGQSAATITGGALKASMDLAATEGLNLADAAIAVSNAMGAFALSAEDLPKVADALAGASKSSTASVESLMQGLSQVGSGAKTAGLSLEETVSILAALDQVGTKGADAGTSLKTMLTKLIPQTKKAQGAFVKYGLSVYKSKAAMDGLRTMGLKSVSGDIEDVTDTLQAFYKGMGQNSAQAGKSAEEWLWVEAFENQLVNANGSMKDAADIAGILSKSLGGLSESAKIEAGSLLFGSDASRAAMALADIGKKGFGTLLKGAQDAGVAAEMAEARTKGFKGAMEKLGGAAETIGIKIGEKLLPTLTGWIEQFTAWVDTPAGTKFFDSLAENVESAVLGVKDYVDNTLAPAIGRVYSYFASPDGQQAIQDWGNSIAGAATALGTLVGWLEKLIGLWDKVPDFLKGNPLSGGGAFGKAEKWLYENRPFKPDDRNWFEGKPLPAQPRQSPTGMGVDRTKPSQTVNVVVNNPKPETAYDSAALALRLRKAMP